MLVIIAVSKIAAIVGHSEADKVDSKQLVVTSEIIPKI